MNGYRTLLLNALLAALAVIAQASDLFSTTKYGPLIVAGVMAAANLLKRYLAPTNAPPA